MIFVIIKKFYVGKSLLFSKMLYKEKLYLIEIIWNVYYNCIENKEFYVMYNWFGILLVNYIYFRIGLRREL